MHSSDGRKSNSRILAALALAFSPIVVFYWLLFRAMRNIPIIDDYPSILTLAVALRQAPTKSAKLALLITSQFHEYKLVFMNTVVALQLWLLGHVNFTFFLVFGNLLVLAVGWLLWKNFCPTEEDLAKRILLFAPVCFLLFQLNWVENLNWAICDLQTVPVLFFTLAALHFLLKPGARNFTLSCVCALLGCFSSANSFLFAPIGFLILLEGRKWRAMVAWVATYTLALGVYLYKYALIQRADDGAHVALWDKIVFYVSFLGAAIENMHRFPVRGGAIVLGVILLEVFLVSLFDGFRKVNPFFFYLALWCLISGAMVAEKRSGIGIILSLLSRYKIYCDFMLIYAYVYGVYRLRRGAASVSVRRAAYGAALAGVFMLATASDIIGQKFLAHRLLRVQMGLDQYEENPAKNVPMISQNEGESIPPIEPEEDRVLLNLATKLGVYHLPPKSER